MLPQEVRTFTVGEDGTVSVTTAGNSQPQVIGNLQTADFINPAGLPVWYAAFAQLYAQPDRAALFAAITDEQARYVVLPPASFAEFHVWPDTRLTSPENPVFSHYIPFVLPLLVRKNPAPLRWDAELAAAENDKTKFGHYLDAVNAAIRFVQPAPAFVLGFDEFDEQHPERLIDKFLDVRDSLLVR